MKIIPGPGLYARFQSFANSLTKLGPLEKFGRSAHHTTIFPGPVSTSMALIWYTLPASYVPTHLWTNIKLSRVRIDLRHCM